MTGAFQIRKSTLARFEFMKRGFVIPYFLMWILDIF